MTGAMFSERTKTAGFSELILSLSYYFADLALERQLPEFGNKFVRGGGGGGEQHIYGVLMFWMLIGLHIWGTYIRGDVFYGISKYLGIYIIQNLLA